MNSQVGHADVVGVRVDEGDGQPASPILDDGTFFPGKPLPGFSEFVLAH